MTSKQKKRLISIAKRDCFCAGNNKVGNMTCIIGAMVCATAKPQSKVYRAMIGQSGSSIDSIGLVSEHLQDRFGLDEEQLCDIQRANDEIDNEDQWPKPNSRENVMERRKNVLAAIRRIKVS